MNDDIGTDRLMVPRISFRSLVVKAYPHRKSIRTTLCEHHRGMQAGSRRENSSLYLFGASRCGAPAQGRGHRSIVSCLSQMGDAVRFRRQNSSHFRLSGPTRNQMKSRIVAENGRDRLLLHVHGTLVECRGYRRDKSGKT